MANDDFKPKGAFQGWVYAEISNLKEGMRNHLKHHWAVDLLLLSIILGLIVKVIKG